MLDEHSRFQQLLAAEVTRAQAFRRSVALLLLRTADRDNNVLDVDAQRLGGCLRPFDAMSVDAGKVIEVLLPETNAEEAGRIARGILTEARSGQDLLVCGLAAYPQHADCAETLIDSCRLAVRRATPDVPLIAANPIRPMVSPLPQGQLVRRRVQPVSESPAMRQVYAIVGRIAPSQISVVLFGATGSGKEVIARAIHHQGPRARKPLVSINCGAIPQTLVESVLFGHERGAFTGALHQAQGVLEQAQGGTVLLDEIGELGLAAQAALLRALDTRRVRRVGGSGEVPIDVRLIAATHCDLEQMCRKGRFRWDLYYRLSGLVLRIPPLCERREDILPLARLFLDQAAHEHGVPAPELEKGVTGILRDFDWPGNVRELRNAIDHAVVLARGGRISIAELPQRLIQFSTAKAVRAGSAETVAPPELGLGNVSMPVAVETDAVERQGADLGRSRQGPVAQQDVDLEQELRPDLRGALRRYEARLILEALRQADWNRTCAAERLGLSVRTLANRIKALGIRRLGFGLADRDVDEPET